MVFVNKDIVGVQVCSNDPFAVKLDAKIDELLQDICNLALFQHLGQLGDRHVRRPNAPHHEVELAATLIDLLSLDDHLVLQLTHVAACCVDALLLHLHSDRNNLAELGITCSFFGQKARHTIVVTLGLLIHDIVEIGELFCCAPFNYIFCVKDEQ